MINSIDIRNFKNISSQTIDFEQLTVVVGANASGKTTLLEALHMAVRAATGDPKMVFGYERHCDWLYCRGGKGDLVLACETPDGRFSVNATPPSDFPPMQRSEIGRGVWQFSIDPPPGDERAKVLRSARSMVFLHLTASELAKASYSDREPPRVEHDGYGLASVLAYMLLIDRDSFDQLEALMCELIPNLLRIRIRKTTVKRAEKELIRFGEDSVQRRLTRTFQGESLLFDFRNASDVSAHTVSEGTLLLLGLLTVLLGPAKPQILLMDDIEHGLHPRAQRALLDILRRVMEIRSELQIVATAHSPFLLDSLEPSQVRLVAADEQGHSVFGRLVDHPEFQKWKDEMAPGEMWSMFGEQWVAGGSVKQ